MRKKSKLSILSFIVLLLVLTVTNSCDPTVSVKLLPVLTTNETTLITQNTVTSGGNISSDNGFEVTARGVCWSLKPNPTIKDSLTKDAAGTGAFTSSIKNLLADTTYYVRAYATNKDGTAYGLQITFKTLPTVLPGVTTTAATNITASTATSGGNVTFNGGSSVTTRGICWSITANPTITNDKTSDGSGSGIFTSNLSNLLTGTTYYVRAYAANSAGTAYGSQMTFKTLSVPTVTTTSVTSITTITANSGGNVTSDGGTTVTARGVCWSTAINPTISNYITTDGSGLGTFTSNLSGLTDGVTYYVRAYATNKVGTTYGNQVSFVPQQSVTDIDGNVYKIVTIGTQTWMASNLRVTHYRNGESITNLIGAADWVGATFGAWCDYDNNDANGTKYGHLYNWYAVSDSRNIAPTGWHVATDAEWTTLTTYVATHLGTSLNVAKALAATTDWTTSSTAGAVGKNQYLNNSTGFSALPGGFRDRNGAFDYLGGYGSWWSSTEYNTFSAWYRNMYYITSYVDRNYILKQDGYSVRCVRD
jgi:uncharacterized protein (TIGR02145 family)